MTTQLKNLLSRLETMPAKEQNAIAELLSQEIEWQISFEKSKKKLSLLAAEAIEEYKKGKTLPLNLK